MPRLLKLIILSSVFLLLGLILPQPTQAAPLDFVKAVQEGNNLQWYLGSGEGMISSTMDALTISITGARDEQGNLLQAGAIQATSSFIGMTYQKPASSVDYVAYLMNHSGLAKSAYAQGKGWEFLTAAKDKFSRSLVIDLWTISRNVTYLFYVVIFVAIGFLIMFRSKLNPQTAINVQLALPKIVVSLVLVTFSFAICGLIVDFVYLGHKLIGALFFMNSNSPLYNILTGSAVDRYWEAVNKVDIVSALFAPSQSTISTGWGDINVFDQFIKFILNIGGTLKDIFLNHSISGLIPLILAFTLLGTGLKIFFGLLTKYVTLILSTIFSPFIFLLSALPGRSEGTVNFFKTMLSAALTFPATAFMFFLSSYFVSNAVGLQLNGLPPLNKTGILQPGQGAIGTFNVLEPLIGLGILMATTQVPQAIDQALGVKAGITGAATPEIGGALRKIPLIGSLLG